MFVEPSDQDQADVIVSSAKLSADLLENLDPDLVGVASIQKAMEFHPGMEEDLLKRTSVADELDWNHGTGNWSDGITVSNNLDPGEYRLEVQVLEYMLIGSNRSTSARPNRERNPHFRF